MPSTDEAEAPTEAAELVGARAVGGGAWEYAAALPTPEDAPRFARGRRRAARASRAATSRGISAASRAGRGARPLSAAAAEPPSTPTLVELSHAVSGAVRGEVEALEIRLGGRLARLDARLATVERGVARALTDDLGLVGAESASLEVSPDADHLFR